MYKERLTEARAGRSRRESDERGVVMTVLSVRRSAASRRSSRQPVVGQYQRVMTV